MCNSSFDLILPSKLLFIIVNHAFSRVSQPVPFLCLIWYFWSFIVSDTWNGTGNTHQTQQVLLLATHPKHTNISSLPGPYPIRQLTVESLVHCRISFGDFLLTLRGLFVTSSSHPTTSAIFCWRSGLGSVVSCMGRTFSTTSWKRTANTAHTVHWI